MNPTPIRSKGNWQCKCCEEEYEPYFILPHDVISMGLDPLKPAIHWRDYCHPCYVAKAKELKKEKEEKKM